MSKRQLPLSSFFRSPSADETDRTAEMTDDDTTHDATDDIENLPTDHTARTTTPSRRSKRQRYTATATDDTTTKADIKAHAEYCMKYHTKQASKQQHPLSFASMKPPPRNATQQSIYVQFLRVCMALVIFLIVHNCVFLPGSYFAKSFNTLHEMLSLSINNNRSHIYWMVNKVGLAGNGAVRLAEYVKKLGAACPPVFSIIDIDNLPEVVQSELTKRMLTAISGFIPSVFPTTIEDAIRMDMTGLSVFLQLFFWSMVHTRERCTRLGGAMNLVSCLRRLYLTMLESGVQEFLRTEGRVAMDGNASAHDEGM